MTRIHNMALTRTGTACGLEGENEYEVRYTITPGTPERGRFGKPEDYDPGSAPEVEIVSFTRDGLEVPEPYPGEIDWMIEQIADQHDFAEEAAERAEYLADQRRDARVTRDFDR